MTPMLPVGTGNDAGPMHKSGEVCCSFRQSLGQQLDAQVQGEHAV